MYPFLLQPSHSGKSRNVAVAVQCSRGFWRSKESIPMHLQWMSYTQAARQIMCLGNCGSPYESLLDPGLIIFTSRTQFYATVCCRLCHLHQATVEGDQNQKWAAGPHKSKTTQRSKCQVHKSASSDGNTHKSKHKLRGRAREKQPEQKQGTKRMPKTRVHSTLCKVLARSQPTLTTQELQFYSWSRELMISQTSKWVECLLGN